MRSSVPTPLAEPAPQERLTRTLPERGVGAAPAAAMGPAGLDSAALLQGGKSVTIRHNGEFYRLQATRQGKLILTK